MARRRAYAPLNVCMNGRCVGTLRRESSGAIDFTYHRDWLGWEHAFPVSLSLPLREDRYVGAPAINVFDNLLPDSEPMRKRVAERVGAAGIDAYSLLRALGHDCVGAMQFLPECIDPGDPGEIRGKRISKRHIAEMIGNLARAPLGMGEDEEFRISIAGAQEKTALLRYNGQWMKPIGTTATTHILKPQIGRLPNGVDLSNSVENEYLCLKLLEAFGIPAAQADIVDFGTHRTLVVERFDRRWTRDGRLFRLPQEDMCQALSVPPTRKYQSEGGPGMRDILRLLKGSDEPAEDIATFMKICIVFWMIGATDGHAKNFSIFLRPGGGFRMTPAYDVLSAQPSLDAGRIRRRQFKLAMSVGENSHYPVPAILPRHFLQTAVMANVGKSVMRDIFGDLAANALDHTDRLINHLRHRLPERLVASVRTGIAQRAALLAESADTMPRG